MSIDPAKLEIYKYVQHEHDALIVAQQGQKTRLGHFLVLIGFLITIAFTFVLPCLMAAVERATIVDISHRSIAMAIATVPFVVLLGVLWYVTVTIKAIIDSLSYIGLTTACVDAEKPVDENAFVRALSTKVELNGDHVILGLTRNYVRAIKENSDGNYIVATRIAKVVKKVRRSVVLLATLVILTLAARLSLYYCIPAPVSSNLQVTK